MDWCGDRPADGVAGGGAWRAGTLSLQHIKAILVLTSDTGFFFKERKPLAQLYRVSEGFNKLNLRSFKTFTTNTNLKLIHIHAGKKV